MKPTIAMLSALLATAAMASPILRTRQSNPTGPFKIQVGTPPSDGHSVSPFEGQFLGITVDPSGNTRPNIVANHTINDAFVWEFNGTEIQTTINVEGQIESWVIEGDVNQIILAESGTIGFGNNIPPTAAGPFPPGLSQAEPAFRGWAFCGLFSDGPALLFAEVGQSLGPLCDEVILTVVPVSTACPV